MRVDHGDPEVTETGGSGHHAHMAEAGFGGRVEEPRSQGSVNFNRQANNLLCQGVAASPLLIRLWGLCVSVVHSHGDGHGMIGTVLIALAGEPLTIFELIAR
jgi:hypothetical protein